MAKQYKAGNVDRDNRDPRIDSRGIFRKAHQDFKAGRNLSTLAGIMTVLPIVSAVVPFGGLFAWITNSILGAVYFNKTRQKFSAPLRMPSYLKYRDGSVELIGKHVISEKDLPKTYGKGTTYLGFDLQRQAQVWVTDDDLTVHVGMIGTTKSGKTTLILTMCANALMKGGGFIYVDAKGDIVFQQQAQMLARYVGREDDFLTISFGAYENTGYGDIKKQTNTFNLMGNASTSAISELLISLMQGEDDMWKGRAVSFISALIRLLVYKRNRYGEPLSPTLILECFSLDKLIEMVYKEHQEDKGYLQAAANLKSCLENVPAFHKDFDKPQSEKTTEQFGYLTMQLQQALADLSYNYGHIFGVEVGEVSMTDVVFNRRILTCLLPALGRSISTLNMLGRLITSSIKQMMSLSLGSDMEGAIRLIVEARPTEARNIFLICYDEAGYMMSEGMSVQPAQARSLKLSMAFGVQSYSNLEKASQIEAQEVWDNLGMKFVGRVVAGEDSSTFGKIAGLVGEINELVQTGVETDYESGGYRSRGQFDYRKAKLITIEDLSSQESGEFTVILSRKSEGGNRGTSEPVRFRTLFPKWQSVQDTTHMILNDFVPLNMQGYAGVDLTGYEKFINELYSSPQKIANRFKSVGNEERTREYSLTLSHLNTLVEAQENNGYHDKVAITNLLLNDVLRHQKGELNNLASKNNKLSDKDLIDDFAKMVTQELRGLELDFANIDDGMVSMQKLLANIDNIKRGDIKTAKDAVRTIRIDADSGIVKDFVEDFGTDDFFDFTEDLSDIGRNDDLFDVGAFDNWSETDRFA